MAFVLKFEFLFNYLIINDKNKYDVIKKNVFVILMMNIF
jgi:hypothetical protein